MAGKLAWADGMCKGGVTGGDSEYETHRQKGSWVPAPCNRKIIAVPV